MLVIHPPDLNECKIDINQEIYFLNELSLEIFEKYTVNEYEIIKKLGHFTNDTYEPTKGVDTNFLKRRSNFMGIQMTAMTEISQGGRMINFENLHDAPYFLKNDTYDVTYSTKGSFYEILKYMEKKLNFTTKLYKRKVAAWGIPKVYPNGSIQISDGMVKDVAFGSLDMIVTGLVMLPERFFAIDYLQTIIAVEG